MLGPARPAGGCLGRAPAPGTRAGIEFLSTPFDDGAADLLDGLGVPAFKVGSGELTNLPFIARLAPAAARCSCRRGWRT